jgi:radical SAM protein with 4Fe4S-binding SPASM domain
MKKLIKRNLKALVKKFDKNDLLITKYKYLVGKMPIPDMEFPKLIGIEICSYCNLKCVHCAPQTKLIKSNHQILNYELFLKIMLEIDSYGPRRISLHKDGEPLLHPKIIDILNRVKQFQQHEVYLSTNAHKLNPVISKSILDNEIDIVNFSIGAATEDFYRKIRGENFNTVITNILNFIEIAQSYSKKPKVQVQIINLPDYPEMKEQIQLFKRFWKRYEVNVDVWEELSWGINAIIGNNNHRYPCFELWNSLHINSDGTVSACCIDWKHELLIGNAVKESIKEMWQSNETKKLRKQHLDDNGASIEICKNCNYWSWHQKLKEYPKDS